MKIDKGMAIMAVIFLVVAGGLGMFALDLMETDEYEYEYTVKAEQVNEDEMVDEAIDYENISDAEQKVLFDAFKKSDHFLGGAEAYIETDEPIENVSNEWRVIEIKGVPMLVSIEGPEKVPADSEIGEDFLGLIVMVVAVFFALLGLAAASETFQ